MLGAIIGDMAAWTWEHEKARFYPQLVSENACLSMRGRVLLEVGDALLSGRDVRKAIEDFWPESKEENKGLGVVCAVSLGWLVEDEKEMQGLVSNLIPCLSEEERCAAHFMADLLYALRHGATKNDAAKVEFIGTFRSFTKDAHWKKANGPLGVFVRAWSAFYNAFDYTSA